LPQNVSSAAARVRISATSPSRVDFGVALPFYKHYARASTVPILYCFLPHLSHATHTRPPPHSLLPHTTNSTVNQHEGSHSRAGGGPLQVSSRAAAIANAQLLTPQQRLGQRRNNWWCHWNDSWRCRSLRCKQKVSFIQGPYAAFPCFPCHLDRNIYWCVILTASSAVDPPQNSKLIVHVSCHCCRSRLGQIRH
jgi:hypothetical protein